MAVIWGEVTVKMVSLRFRMQWQVVDEGMEDRREQGLGTIEWMGSIIWFMAWRFGQAV